MRMTSTLLLATALLAANPYSEGVQAALADIQTVPPVSRSQVRYLLALTEDDLPAASFVLNAVSRTRVIRQPKVVGNGVLRIQLAWLYGTDKTAAKEILAAWEQLDEPYFARDLAHQSLALACQTGSPILRADSFVAQVAGESEHYYRFANIPPRLDDFYKSLGLVVSEVERVRAELNANLFISQVTGKPRRVVHYLSPFGSVFVTQDEAVEKAGNSAVVPAIVPKGYKFQFDAQEIFALGPNATWRLALYDAKGNRQAAVPANIAVDTLGPLGHGEVIPMISCLRCHEAGGSAGLRPLRDQQVIIPSVGDRDEIQKLQDAHDPDALADHFTAAGIRNIKAIARITQGMVREGDHVRAMIPQEATNALSGVYESFVGGVDLEKAAKERGVTKEQLKALLGTSQAAGAFALLAGESITRTAFEETWGTIP